MFAVGHLSFGYLFAKVFQRLLKTHINLPFIFLLSLISDIDLLIPWLTHRTVTTSIIISTIMFIPFFLIYRKSSVPYFAALTQHILLGDFLTNEGVQMFWPLTSNRYGLGVPMQSLVNILIEGTSFILVIIILIRTKDLQRLLNPHKSNLFLVVPSGAIFMSSIVGMSNMAPIELLFPHLVYLAIFTFSMWKFLVNEIYKTLER